MNLDYFAYLHASCNNCWLSKVTMMEVACALSIGTKINDLG